MSSSSKIACALRTQQQLFALHQLATMKILSSVILLATIINVINGTPEIKSADPSQHKTGGATLSFLTVQEQRYAEAVKDRQRPLRTRVITPGSYGDESKGRDSVSNRPVSSLPAGRYETIGNRQYSRQPVIPQKTDRHESYGRGNHLVTSTSAIPQKTDRHESYGRGNHLVTSTSAIPQKTDRHESYGRGNHLVTSTSAIPQKTDRHEKPNQSVVRNDKLYSYRTEDLRSRSRTETSDAVEELWSTRDGSVKSEITDSRLKLTRPKYVEGVKG